MANIIFREGFETYANVTSGSIGLPNRWAGYSNAVASVEPSLITGRFDNNALRIAHSGSSVHGLISGFDSAVDEFTLGFAFRTPLSEISNSAFLSLGYASTMHLGIVSLQDGSISIGRHTANPTVGNNIAELGRSNPVTQIPNTWTYYELEGCIHNTLGELRLYREGDDVPLISLTGQDTLQTGSALISAIRLGTSYLTDINTDFDDIYVTDSMTTGRLGPIRIGTLKPTSDVHQGFTRSTGADNFALVDDRVGDNTDYVSGSSVGDYDVYEMENMTNDPINIFEVNHYAYMNKNDSASRAMSLGLDQAGTETVSVDQYLGTGVSLYRGKFALNPDGSVPWTKSAVNALRARPKITV